MVVFRVKVHEGLYIPIKDTIYGDRIVNLGNLIKNGILATNHSREKMFAENISMEQIREVLLNGKPEPDRSTTNYRERAWNRKQHYSVYYERLNLTVVCCESLEKGVLVVSVFHGLAHDMASNPHNRSY